MEKGEFFSYSWYVDENEKTRTVIRIYGLNSKNESICIIVNNFLPYVYLELPDNVEWNNSRAGLVVNKLNNILQDYKPVTYELVFKKKLYYANIDSKQKRRLYPFLKCCCSHIEDIRQLGNRIRKPVNIPSIGVFNLKIHENNASPILQLTSLQKLPPAGWILFSGKKVQESDKISYCLHEYTVKWENLAEKPSDLIVKPLLMGYDIEVNSSIPSSMPKAHRPQDKIFQVSCIFARQGCKPDTYEKYLLTLGEPDIDTLGENINVFMYETEADLILGFTALMQEKQPNVIIGYNIFTFDIPYMIDRAKLHYCFHDFDRQGMNKDSHAKERTIEWSSSAYKNQSFQFLDAEGRIFVDLLPLVKRDYKMNNYKLKTIASHFLKDITKDPLDAKAIFKCYRLGMQGDDKGKKALGLVGKYCLKDSELVVRLFDTLTTWIALCELSKVTNVPIFQLYTQGQQIRVFSQVYKKCTHENIVVERDGYIVKDQDHYIGAMIFPPVAGIYDKVVPFDFCSLYPSTIIAYNISWDTLVDNDNVPDDVCHVMEWQECIGCIHDPKEIRKAEINKLIKEEDMKLKEMRKKRDLKENSNRKEEFKLKIAEFIKSVKPLRDERSQLNKSKAKHIICANRKYRWLKNPMGVLPSILTSLLNTRKITKSEMKVIKGKLREEVKEGSDEYFDKSIYLDVLDQRQLALKISANSAYGSMGVRRGYLPLMPGAMCTTFMGREAIEKAANTIQKDWNGVLVYGDTDSSYCSFPHLKTIQECYDYAAKVAVEVSKLYPPPMSLAFEEKIYERFFILTKKRYMSLECERDGSIKRDKNGKIALSTKGVLLQRRDNCAFIRKVYEAVVMMIFNKENKEDVLYYIITELNKLCSACYSIADFVVTKSVGDIGDLEPTEGKDKDDKPCYKIGDYKVKLLPTDEKEREKQFKLKKCTTEQEYYRRCLPAHVQLAEKIRERGQLVASGSRLEYIITTQGGHNAKQYEKVEDSDYFSRHSYALEIDYLYYLKQLSTPLDQILNIIYSQTDFLFNQYKYRLQVRGNMLTELKNIFLSKLCFDTAKKI